MSARSADTSGSAGTGRMRARDVDRVNVRARLDAAYEEGQLGAAEYHDRSERARDARTLGELDRLVADLQATPGATQTRVPTARPSRRGSGYPPRTRARDEDRAAACALLDAALGDGQLRAADHRALTELAGEAKSLGELADLTDDLQRPVGTPADARPPTSVRGYLFPVAMVTVSLVAAVGAFVWAHQPETPPAPPPAVELGAITPKIIGTPNFTTGAGIAQFRDDYRAKFGTTLVDEVSFFEAHISVTQSPQPNRMAKYTYRSGFELSTAPAVRQTTTATADLAEIDTAALDKLLAEAPALLKVENGAVTHIGFEPQRGGPPVLSVYVDNSFEERGNLTATPAGAILRTSPFKG
ncbi:DUF1707 domain-containing protein [Nocardia sp. NPDC005978]|uniref:DUF1707 domain-containing protein n=1 Tax=Nocardia sp. NPDC005978 TaxID=3156725 RepID=UPI0033B8DC2A